MLKWGERWESNPRPLEPQSSALPTELRPPLFLARLAGLEPATLGLEGRCSIQMSYRRMAQRLLKNPVLRLVLQRL